MPKELPTVNDLHHWLALTAVALVAASVYDDRAEVAWFSKVNDPRITFEALADSERDRFKNLEVMLANLLQSKIGKAGELGRLVATKSQSMYRMGNRITGAPDRPHPLCAAEDRRQVGDGLLHQ